MENKGYIFVDNFEVITGLHDSNYGIYVIKNNPDIMRTKGIASVTSKHHAGTSFKEIIGRNVEAEGQINAVFKKAYVYNHCYYCYNNNRYFFAEFVYFNLKWCLFFLYFLKALGNTANFCLHAGSYNYGFCASTVYESIHIYLISRFFFYGF